MLQIGQTRANEHTVRQRVTFAASETRREGNLSDIKLHRPHVAYFAQGVDRKAVVKEYRVVTAQLEH